VIKLKVKVKDRGFEKAARNLEMLGDRAPRVFAGVLGTEALADHGGITNAEVATFHEFGTDRVPQRSFLRSTHDEKRAQIQKQLGNAAGKVLDGEDPKRAFGLVGAWFVGLVQRKIRSRISPPLAESTIEKKGSDVPLIDSSQLIKSLTWEIREKKR